MKNRLFLYLSYLVLVSFVVTGITFSRYDTVTSGSDEANAAQAVFEYVPISATINGDPIADIQNGISVADVKPGDELIYYFDIKNYDGSNINQVLLKYNIDVSFSPNPTTLPLTYLLTPADSYPSAGGNWIYLGFDSEETHSYMLMVLWAAADDNPSYIGKQQNVQIQINTEQADSAY